MLDDILENFDLLDDWEDRYRYVIELGKSLEPLPEEARTADNKVQGCVSQVWLITGKQPAQSHGEGPLLVFQGDSDAHIVRGLIAILFAIYSGKSAKKILETDSDKIFKRLGLREHLTPQRSNGLSSMISRIQSDAKRYFQESMETSSA